MREHCELLLFFLAERTFALRLPSVEKIVMAAEITPLPEAPNIVLGVINIQGEIVPVIDTRKRFQFASKAADLDNFFIIGKMARRKAALLVDAIGDIVRIDEKKIVDAEDILPGIACVDGAVKLEGDIIFIHDLERCLSLNEERELAAALKEYTEPAGEGPAE